MLERSQTTNGLVVILGIACCVALSVGCASKSIEVTHPDVVDLSTPLPDDQFSLPYDARLGKVRLALAQVTSAVAVTGRKSEFEELTRGQLTELLASCPNFVVANRSASAEAAAEWSLVANNAANPRTVPSSPGVTIPEYLVKVTITQVERNIKGSGKESEWTLYVATRSKNERRDGAVELTVEIIDLATTDTVYVTRAHGLLFDEKSSSGLNILGIGGGKKEFTRVPENQAIRAACKEAVMDIHEFFVATQS